MKTTRKFFLAALLWLVLFSCLHDEYLRKDSSPSSGIRVNLGIDISVKDVNERKASVNTDNFIIDIFHSDGTLAASFNRYADMPDTVALEPGSYYAEARSGNLQPAGFDCPWYSGRSETVTLNPEEIHCVSILCSLGNCKLKIIYSQRIVDRFINFYTVITTSDTSLTVLKNENRYAYFALNPLTLTAYLEYFKPDGSTGEKQLHGSIEEPEKQKYYEVHLDAGLDGGSALVALNVDESSITEMINISDQGSIPGIGYGDLLITEIMYDPDSVSDPNGEWFEIYNSSPDTIDLFHLVISKDASSHHVINEHINLRPSGYFVMARTDAACEAEKHIYGTSLSLPNSSPFTLSLSSYGSDGTDGILIATVNYNKTNGFPAKEGSSVSLDPDHFQADQAQSGVNWCLSTSVYNTLDKGTPGQPNDNCD